MRKYMIALFNLKQGVNPEHFETWMRTAAAPTVRSLKSVEDMRVNRVVGTLDGSPPAYQYMELIVINDFDQLREAPGARKSRRPARPYSRSSRSLCSCSKSSSSRFLFVRHRHVRRP